MEVDSFNVMKEIAGQTFSIARDNEPVRGCTVSKMVWDGSTPILYFACAANTDISAESFPYHKLIFVNMGTLKVYGKEFTQMVSEEQCIITPTDVPVGMKAEAGCVYTEVEVGKDIKMNEAIAAGEAFKLADKLPYQEGKIVNMDVVHNDKMKFALMAFDEGQGLSEHSAPGEALVFALDGEGVIGYEGKEHSIKAGENFHFAKNGMHWVKAKTKFKMALLLALD